MGRESVGTGGPPTVTVVGEGCIAAKSGAIKAGMLLHAVNGVAVSDHEEATALLKLVVSLCL